MCRDFENKLGFRRKLFGKVGRSRRDRRRVGLAYLFSGESLIVRFLGHVFFSRKDAGTLRSQSQLISIQILCEPCFLCDFA